MYRACESTKFGKQLQLIYSTDSSFLDLEGIEVFMYISPFFILNLSLDLLIVGHFLGGISDLIKLNCLFTKFLDKLLEVLNDFADHIKLLQRRILVLLDFIEVGWHVSHTIWLEEVFVVLLSIL
jgi:hypothetical protein